MMRSDDTPRTTIRWYRVYLVLTAVTVVLLGMEWFEIPPVAALPMGVAAGIAIGAFIVVSALYWYDVYRWRHGTDEVPPQFETSLDEEVVEENRKRNSDDEDEY